MNWDLRYFNPSPVTVRNDEFSPTSMGRSGTLAVPGTYKVKLEMIAGGEVTELAGPVEFKAEPLDIVTLPAPDREAVAAFQKKMADLSKVFMGMGRSLSEEMSKVIIKTNKSAIF